MAYTRNIAALVAVLVFRPAWPVTPPLTAIRACASVTDDKARLECFDRQLALLAAPQDHGASTAAAGAAPEASDSSAAAAGAKLTPEQRMGLPRNKVERLEAAPGTAPEPPLQNFTASIRSVSVGTNQRQVFVLDNDQVWRQAETNTSFAVHPGDTVRISRGALGSFFMTANVHSATRVARVR